MKYMEEIDFTLHGYYKNDFIKHKVKFNTLYTQEMPRISQPKKLRKYLIDTCGSNFESVTRVEAKLIKTITLEETLFLWKY